MGFQSELVDQITDNVYTWISNEEGIYHQAMECNSMEELRELLEEICKIEHLGQTMYITANSEDLTMVSWDQLWYDLKGEDEEDDLEEDQEDDNDFSEPSDEEEDDRSPTDFKKLHSGI